MPHKLRPGSRYVTVEQVAQVSQTLSHELPDVNYVGVSRGRIDGQQPFVDFL